MAWCEKTSVDFIFGLSGNAVLKADPVIARTADACAVHRAVKGLPSHRVFCETTYAAKSWGDTKRRVIARIEASTLGMDVRTIVTSLIGSTPERLYAFDYCARGQAENLIKLHKTQLKSDRTSCSSACANQMRLILHTAAYWLLWAVRQSIPDSAPLKQAEFTTLQLRLVKIGARIIETASRIRTRLCQRMPGKGARRSHLSSLRPGSQTTNEGKTARAIRRSPLKAPITPKSPTENSQFSARMTAQQSRSF